MDQEKQRIFGLRSQIEKYFENQAQILISQAQAASFLSTHSRVVGDAGEQGLRLFLRNHLPQRYGVGTGHIVSFQKNSAQIDTVIFDSLDCFNIPITEEATLYSIEGVYGAIEVKSSPSRKNIGNSIKKAVANISTVKSLIYHPFYFSNIPTFNRFSDVHVSKSNTPGYRPICAIMIIGSSTNFETAIRNLKKETLSEIYPHVTAIPDLFCVLDEKNFGLYGYDSEIKEKRKQDIKYWREKCNTPGQTLALFHYWLLHKMILERVTEAPIFHNTDQTTIWPAVMAPIISRMHVDVSDDGHQTSWGFFEETREFENSE